MPNKSEILEHIDRAYELASEAGTARWRLYDLLKKGEFDEGDRLEALVLVKGVDPDDLTMAVGAIRRDIDGDGDDESDNEPANPGSSGMLMALGKLYEAQHAIHAMLHAIRNMEITETIAVDTDAHTCAALHAANQILDAGNEIEAAAGVNFHYGLLTDEDRRQLRGEMWGPIG